MLQQTQVSRVIGFYKRWCKVFPTFRALAHGPTALVLKEWSGLGYNSRALRLHRLAKHVSGELKNRLPRTVGQLRMLEGVGNYTAHAIACFAYDQHVPVVDVNIRRILTRLTKKVSSSAEMIPEADAWLLAEQFLPSRNAYTWNQSLMDLGALVCTAARPECGHCPLSRYCRSAFSKVFLQTMRREKKKEPAWKGIPRRLYRGRILKLLHDRRLSMDEIAALLWTAVTPKDSEWLEAVLQRMEREGLVQRYRKRFGIVP